MKITPYNVAMVGQGPIWVLFTAAFRLSLTAHPLISPMASCLHAHNQTTKYWRPRHCFRCPSLPSTCSITLWGEPFLTIHPCQFWLHLSHHVFSLSSSVILIMLSPAFFVSASHSTFRLVSSMKAPQTLLT